MIDRLKVSFQKVFPKNGSTPRFFFSPGRVNVIGEHVDYCGGNVLPGAITIGAYAAVAPRQDDQIFIFSKNLTDHVKVTLEELEYREDRVWANYVLGVFYSLKRRGAKITGMDIFIESTLPLSVGLASSTSLCLLAGVIVESLFDFPIDRMELARVALDAEKQYMGLNVGIMDPFVITMGKREHFLLLNCESFKFRLVKLEAPAYQFVLINTNKKRNVEFNTYQERKETCDKILRKVQTMFPTVKHLAELNMDHLEEAFTIFTNIEKKRSQHIVSECMRVKEAVQAIQQKDFFALGKIMHSSHLSLKNDYNVSCKELDVVVDISKTVKGVLGSKMVGGGLGGCVITLIEKEAVEHFKTMVGAKYKDETGLEAEFFSLEFSNGAGELKEVA